MRKRLALFTAALGIIAAGVVAFMAFESYTLDINAHLEPVLSVNPHGDWNLGIVYPETDVSTKLFVGLSNSAKTDRNFRSVSYTIACQKKTGEDTPEGAISLCPNIEVESQDGFGARQCGLGDLVDEPNSCKLFNRSIVGGDNQHGYSIDILWPDCLDAVQKDPGFATKTVDCGFDPATGKFAGVDLAAIISIAVGDIVQAEKCITDKDGNDLPDCVKGPINVDQIVDLDGIASPLAGGAADQEVQKGDDIIRWVPVPIGGLEGIDVFDNDFDGAWTKGIDDIHLEANGGACPTGQRETTHNLDADCIVLDLDGSLFDGQQVTCDLEGNVAFISPCPARLAFHDLSGNGQYDNGEDIVLDNNLNGIFD